MYLLANCLNVLLLIPEVMSLAGHHPRSGPCCLAERPCFQSHFRLFYRLPLCSSVAASVPKSQMQTRVCLPSSPKPYLPSTRPPHSLALDGHLFDRLIFYDLVVAQKKPIPACWYVKPDRQATNVRMRLKTATKPCTRESKTFTIMVPLLPRSARCGGFVS